MEEDSSSSSMDDLIQSRDEKDQAVTRYLDWFLSEEGVALRKKWPRVTCCGSSRSLYCHECLRLLVPKEDWPKPLLHGSLKLPFELHVVLDDHRAKATGLHPVILLGNKNQPRSEARDNPLSPESTIKNPLSPTLESVKEIERDISSMHIRSVDGGSEHIPSGLHSVSEQVKVIELERGEPFPLYDDDDDKKRTTFVLFPSPGESVPLSSVASRISRLIVLDCRWTKSSSRKIEELKKLQKVHLTMPPEKSHYWRWHNAGPEMLSTIEAIYYATMEMAESLDWTVEQRSSLMPLLWLFGLQRSAASALDASGRFKHISFSEAGKEERRELRRTRGTPKHEKDKEKGRQLKAEAKRLAQQKDSIQEPFLPNE
mmetsp:Transcript_15415/g.27987  ORF Transcript_15415/g.27987 Transcript_15415/m.27987 type:complete len:371 (-) Transcript_15415:29-1141(-)